MKESAAADPGDTPLEREISRLAGGELDDRAWARIGEALRRLHDRFVSDALPEQGPPYLQDGLALAAYLAYFFPASQAQVRRGLAELPRLDAPALRVLDVGSGPGPASFAVADWAGKPIQVTALETSAAARRAMESLWPAERGSLKAQSWEAGAPLPAGPFEVIVISHALNELFAGDPRRLDRRQALMDDLKSRLAPSGYLVMVEPALRRTGRELLVVRDRLLAHGMVARAPCIYQGPCPAIARPRDWCHADRPWDATPLVVRASEAAGLSRGSLKFAYVVLSPAGSWPERPHDTSLFRIVSEPLPEKGKLRFFGCGPAGRHPLTRLDRDKSAENSPFDTLERGDVVRIDGLVASGDGKRLGAANRVEITVSAQQNDVTGP